MHSPTIIYHTLASFSICSIRPFFYTQMPMWYHGGPFILTKAISFQGKPSISITFTYILWSVIITKMMAQQIFFSFLFFHEWWAYTLFALKWSKSFGLWTFGDLVSLRLFGLKTLFLFFRALIQFIARVTDSHINSC